MPIEFTCEGCGETVFQPVPSSRDGGVPAHGLCMTCAWVSEHVPGPEGVKVIDALKRSERAAVEQDDIKIFDLNADKKDHS